MAKKYDFTPDADMALNAVHESEQLLRITLSDQQIAEAIRRVLDRSDA